MHSVYGTNDFVFQQNSAPAHRTAHMQELSCCVKKRQIFCSQPLASKQHRSQSCGLWDLGCHAASCLPDKSIVWMNWNGGSSMSGAGLNNRFLMRLLTSGEEDFEHVSTLKEEISSAACELIMLILSISVTFNVTCSTVTYFITKSCQQRWPIHSCSFYEVVH